MLHDADRSRHDNVLLHDCYFAVLPFWWATGQEDFSPVLGSAFRSGIPSSIDKGLSVLGVSAFLCKAFVYAL